MISIRTAELEDLPTLRDIFRRASLSNAGDRETLLLNPEALVLAPDGVIEGRTRAATDADGLILGFATVSFSASDEVDVEDLFVDPDAMRRGVGRRLIEDILGRAVGRGAQRVAVTANPHAYSFYTSVGFRHVRPVTTPLGRGSRMELAVTQQAPSP